MKIKQKIIAVFMTTILLGTNLITLGNQVIAASTNLDGQNSKTNHANVEFNSYLEGNTHEMIYDTQEEAKIYVQLQVKEAGYLKNGIVEFNNVNYQILDNQINNEYVQKIEENKIYLKQINYNQNIIIEIPIQLSKQETVSQDIFAKESIVNFEGNYVDKNGNTKVVEKTVTNRVIWKVNAELELAGEISKYIPYHIGEEYGVLMQAKINVGIKDNKLPIKNTQIEINVPNMNQLKPSRVNVIANTTKGTNGNENGLSFGTNNYTYDAENAKITIQVQNVVNQEGKISWKQGQDEYIINYIYTGEEIYNLVTKQLEQAKQTALEIKELQQEVNEANEQKNEEQQSNQNVDAILVEIPVKLVIEAYNGEETNLQMEGKIQDSIEEPKGNIADFNIEYTKEISKGYIYANYAKTEKENDNKETEGKIQTEYEVSYSTQIYDTQICGVIEYDIQSENMLSQGEEYSSKNNIIIKEIKIPVDLFNKMLGEEGIIQVSKKDGTEIGTINKDTQKDNNGNYLLDISSYQITEGIIKTSLPISEGKLEITVKKAFKTDLTYTKEQMEIVNGLLTKVKIKTNSITEELTKEISLIEPVTRAEIDLAEEKQNLSTIIENKDVNIRILLDTSDIKNALYKNPLLEIHMPKQISNIEIKDINLLLDDELKIKEYKVIDQNGQKIIKIQLEGIQTKYYATDNKEENNVIAKGANIILNTNITINPLTPSESTEIIMYYINENTNIYEQTYQQKAKTNNTQVIGMTKADVNLVAPLGVAAASGISGYDEQNSEIINFTEEKKEGQIEIYSSQKNVTIQGIVTNNYSNSIENVMILGRIPFERNKQIDKTTELGSNFTMPMSTGITVDGIESSKIKTYYSTNEEATKDLLNSENGWTETPEDLSAIKSYLIVFSGEIVASTQFSFSYTVTVPENLSYNKSSYTTYKVYYDAKTENGIIGESEVAGTIGLSTGAGPEVKITVHSNIPKDTNEATDVGLLPTKGAARFWVEIENTGEMDATNSQLVINVPNNTNVARYSEDLGTYVTMSNIIEIGTLAPKEKREISYYLLISDIKNQTSLGQITKMQVSLTADNIKGAIKSDEISLKILPAQFSIINKTNTEENDVYSSKDTITYEIKLSNNSGPCNITIKVPLPKNANILEAYWNEGEPNTGIEIQENQIIAKGSFSGDEKNLIVEFQVANDDKMNFSTKVTAQVENVQENAMQEIYSNEQYIYIDTPELSGNQKLPEEVYVKEKQEFYYEFTIYASEKGNHTNFVLEDILPDGVEMVNVTVNIENPQNNSYGQTETVTQDGNKLLIKIPHVFYSSEVNIKIKVKATLKNKEEDGKKIINRASIYSDQVEKIELNSITQYVEYDENTHKNPITDGETGENTNDSYKITGTAWLDTNQNGNKEDDETRLSGIQVLLVYFSNNNIVIDEDTNQPKITTTNDQGQYEFTNVKRGKYLVIFLYDASQYSVTSYQKEGIGNNYNSDAVNMKIILDGEQRYAGVTDTIHIQDSNARDIDIGLYKAEKFDLRLDKYITKITLTTPTIGTSNYFEGESQLEKVEILAQNVNKSNIIVEYKIRITNEGQVPGYARKIIDYLPKDTGFNTEINQDWYISNDHQNIYNSSLANEVIQPGESKEVTLVLTFNITDTNLGGIITNQAEIYESYNEQGLVDFDSEVANESTTEDDFSVAEIVLGTVTGTIILYTSLALGIILLIITGIIIIKKKVIKK